jgi:hypothetical protein
VGHLDVCVGYVVYVGDGCLSGVHVCLWETEWDDCNAGIERALRSRFSYMFNSCSEKNDRRPKQL